MIVVPFVLICVRTRQTTLRKAGSLFGSADRLRAKPDLKTTIVVSLPPARGARPASQ
jgi:hypothetical protein